MVSIKIKLLVISLVIALVPLLVLGLVNLNQTTEILSNNVQDSLNTIVKSKEAALVEYIDRAERAGKSVADTEVVIEYAGYLNRELTANETADLKPIQDKVDNLIHAYMEAHWGELYHHIYITDLTGTVILSPNHGEFVAGSPSSHAGAVVSDNPYFNAALTGPSVTDYFSFAESNHHHQLLFYPIKDSDGVTQGVIGYELMVSKERKILSEGMELGETGKVYLATLDGTPIVHLRENEVPAVNTAGMREAINTGSSVGISQNAEGVEVIAYYQKNDVYPWIMVAEIETAEAFKSVDEIKSDWIMGMVITSLLVIVLALLLANYIVNPIKKLTVAADKASKGDYDVKISVDSTDEVGQLAGAFQSLIAAVKFLVDQTKKK